MPCVSAGTGFEPTTLPIAMGRAKEANEKPYGFPIGFSAPIIEERGSVD